jgi:Uma2 family endonuclease
MPRMNLISPQPVITADDLLTRPDGDHYELVDGNLVEMHMGTQASYIGLRLSRLLASFCENPFIGWVLPADASFQMILPQRPNLVRKPDVSFVRAGRFPNETLPEGHSRLAPDLAVEVVSPNDTYYEVAVKLAEYRAAGVRLIWVVIPPTRTVQIRRLDGTLAEVGEEGELTGEDVVPGFRCSVRELFQPPAGAGQSAP